MGAVAEHHADAGRDQSAGPGLCRESGLRIRELPLLCGGTQERSLGRHVRALIDAPGRSSAALPVTKRRDQQ